MRYINRHILYFTSHSDCCFFASCRSIITYLLTYFTLIVVVDVNTDIIAVCSAVCIPRTIPTARSRCSSHWSVIGNSLKFHPTLKQLQNFLLSGMTLTANIVLNSESIFGFRHTVDILPIKATFKIPRID